MKRFIKPQTPKAEIEKFNANQFVLENVLFEQQLAFVNDPAPFKVAVCSRRSGKTVACAAHLIHTALNHPDVSCLYITLSGVSGKRIIWKEFKKMLKNFGIKAKVNDLELSITFQNGAVVYVVGAKDASEIEKFRGMAMKLVYIDECQSFREYIQDLIDDIIAPALMDYAGSLCLIGTPGPVETGYFWDCWSKDNSFSKHYWTYWENPFIPITSKMTHQQLFDREMKRRGITDVNTPSVQREWFGKWVTDTESLLVTYDPHKNHYDTLPANKRWTYILGVDVGFKDADALAVLGWTDDAPDTYLIEEIITAKQGITELVEQIEHLRQKFDISKIVMDMGGLGKKIGEEMIRRYRIPVEAADKTRKMENIALMNDALRTGRLKAKKDSRFAQDTYLVEIDKDKSRPDKIAVSSRYHSDAIDAVLYPFRLSPAYAWEPEKKGPAIGSKEWAEAQENNLFEEALGHYEGMEQRKREYGDF